MKRQQFLSAFIGEFRASLAQPTEDLPVTRCISGKTWRRLARHCTAKVAEASAKRFPQRDTLDDLLNLGVLHPIELQPVGTSGPVDSLLAFTATPDEVNTLTPAELALAMVPNGIMSYFSALEKHGLTTHIPNLYHAAVLQHSPKKHAPLPAVPPTTPVPARAISLGKPLFRFRGADFYKTQVAERLASDAKAEFQGPSTIVRTVSLAQSLILTLHRPTHCGGPEVVQEAWEEAAERVDWGHLANLLATANDDPLTRRVGWLTQELRLTTGPAMDNVLLPAKQRAHQAGGRDVTPMFVGFHHRAIDPEWWVEVP